MADDRIRTLNTVSFKRKTDGRRVKGTVLEIRRGTYLVKTRQGVMFAIHARDITKECR